MQTYFTASTLRQHACLLFGVIILLSCILGFFILDARDMLGTIDNINMQKVYISIVILICAAYLFFTELLPITVTSVLVPCAFNIFGVITVKEAWMNFGNPSILTIIGLFMLGEATFSTGLAQRSAKYIINKVGKSDKTLLIAVLAMCGILSAFLNNAGVTAMTLPMFVSLARRAKMHPSKILLPAAYAATIGGTMTLVGTAPNLLTNALLGELAPDSRVFGFFEFGFYGVPYLILTLIMYYFFYNTLVPHKELSAESMAVEEEDVPDNPKMWVAGAVYLGVIVVMATGAIPLATASMLGGVMLIITRCLTVEGALRGVDWATYFMFAGALTLGLGMEKSGAAQVLADVIVSYISDPITIFYAACILTAVMTTIISNIATIVIMIPLIIPIALDLGVSPLPYAMGVTAAASACFLTPMATASNIIILKAAELSFFDYLRYGWPVQVLAVALILLLVPFFWPIYV